MKSKWLKKKMKYDGTQLRSLYAYLQQGVLGDSVIAWRGPCEVSFDHMVDGEDLLERSEIRGSDMIHFLIEVFDQKLLSGVLVQRLFASILKDLLLAMSPVKNLKLERSGDDLYWGTRKLSISIATSSPVSTLVHFAINVSAAGTPVAAAGLDDLQVPAPVFAKKALAAFVKEYESSLVATRKVRPVP